MVRGHGPNPNKKNKNVRAFQRAEAAEREALEREFAARLVEAPELEQLVTAKDAREEDFHRWHRYRQGFAPALVRSFLETAFPVGGPILDPFSGSGTVVTECARRRSSAVGVDALASLVAVANARFGEIPPAWPELPETDDPKAMMEAATHPQHRAAVLLAEAGAVDGEGRRLRGLEPLGERVRRILTMMAEDLRVPLRGEAKVIHGDARALPFERASIGGILTSPPYLARYDYARINAPLERLLPASPGGAPEKKALVRSSTERGAKGPAQSPHPAVAECIERLTEDGDRDLANVARAYFADMGRAIAECGRVAAPGAPFWLNVAGADLKRVYVPADLILASVAEDSGFEVEEIRVARRLRSQWRRLGDIEESAPREVVILLRKEG